MPAFKDSLTDGQVAELASYLRQQFAPDRPAWTNIEPIVGRIRQETLPSWYARGQTHWLGGSRHGRVPVWQ